MMRSVATSDAPAEAEPVGPRRRGRPRDARADGAILDAAVALLVEVGYAGFTIDAVAHRAGVGKATIYRRWDTKEQLVLDALTLHKPTADAPDTGDLRADLHAIFAPFTEPVAQQKAVRLLPALAAEAALDTDSAERLREFIADRRRPGYAVLERAVAQGLLPPGTDVELVVDLIMGGMLSRMLFTRSRVDAEIVDQVLDLVMPDLPR